MVGRLIAMNDDGILSLIGNTPILRLRNIFKYADLSLYAKLEVLNPGGSIKDRAAVSIIKHAIESGEINSDSIVIESSSGNMGIGLAQVCAYYGIRFICVVDPKTTHLNTKILKAYGTEVDLVKEPDPTTGEFLQARINRVKYLLKTIDNSFWPNQYANLYNPIAHHRTMHEIITAVGRKIDYLFCAVSTCGTLRGCAEYLEEHGLKTKIIAVDAVGSALFGSQRAKRLIPGHGAAVRPQLFRPNLADHCVHITDLECVIGCRRLVKEEAILVGGSSGAVFMAVERTRHMFPEGATCVMIFPDRGERYLDTIYSDEWVAEHFGDIRAHL